MDILGMFDTFKDLQPKLEEFAVNYAKLCGDVAALTESNKRVEANQEKILALLTKMVPNEQQ